MDPGATAPYWPYARPRLRTARRERLTGRNGCAALVSTLLALFAFVGPAHAITTAFGISPLFQDSLVADDAWKGIGMLTIGGSTCTGTVITTQQVLTAAHCFF